MLFLALKNSVGIAFVVSMLISLLVIIASIRWLKDIYKIKKENGDKFK